jgi:transcriptional regulator with GAF, ATPase, and Fis domain
VPLTFQSKLLELLQSGAYTPIGSEKVLEADVWVIAASNRDLQEHIRAGKFRQDLYDRLSEQEILIEPLRRKPEGFGI